ncbi:glycerophosphodiester phosphodiesterase family protein [Mycoplasmoides pneumoniae]|uniref:Glycerophosphodiester phosphodiesterase family protein n=3 Tax=Mycoplasmoides pneumoniae TaxID=2104 RepID=A0AAV5N9Y2_MYCPM|nr:glycerophosphodiester phosphodiesterase [Mycoplasmoides pneumoniae]ADK86945.1 glycerophosphodiester phosphodiesterase family protein [Mycoplasmoides pneumoniae FH]ALA30727.1 hypothetical protein B434_00865 [Mycoplasmoides pneumoniae 19294]ALA31832.1 hypothetical protein F536_03195 [Mycoplasmoides pneumoniae 39443]ALA36061.1 hypothetical protein F539_03200 [Mycoplasmoides pneumoniae FH]ALA36771.1 hypothetical protein F538_03215 [Mycoplasmoides pneumoniae M1139]
MRKQFLIAHRGYSTIAPENTHLAFAAAQLFGFDGLWMEVQLTKDKQIVVTNLDNYKVGNKTHKLSDINLVDLKKINLAKQFKVNVQEQTILTLKEVLMEFLTPFRFLLLFIKGEEEQQNQVLVEQLAQLLEGFELAKEKLILLSSHFSTIKYLNEKLKSFKTSFVFNSKKQLVHLTKDEITQNCRFLAPNDSFYHKNCAELQSYGLPIILWVIKGLLRYQFYENDRFVKFQIAAQLY